jgi:hypothetical protein
MLIYADLQRTDDDGRLILSCHGTLEDLSLHGIDLHNGLQLNFYMDDGDSQGKADYILFDGIVTYDEKFSRWVATIDRSNFQHASELEK